MKVLTFRLKPGDDLRKSIEKFALDKGLKAASIVTCVGGLKKLHIRMAGATPIVQNHQNYSGNYEIVSLVGTVSSDGAHLHIAVSDVSGNVFGGHLKEGSIVDPTAEIVIIDNEGEIYKRIPDPETGFPELNVM